MSEYDSRADTLEHIANVQKFIGQIVTELRERANTHDFSKLSSPEKNAFDKATPKLKNLTYGSSEYKESLKGIKHAVDHHYMLNRHHPEYHTDGFNDMDLVDIVEMLCDWKAATLRHNDGNIYNSITHNTERFLINNQCARIFFNTLKSLKW